MDGIIIINKEKGLTSHDIVKNAKKIFNAKVGHTGTLDPNATGVLPLLIGKGTELSKYLINHDKTYEAILQLGEKTNTGDIEGNIIEEKIVKDDMLIETQVTKIFKNMIGKQQQQPPIYSAIKVNGKKLYEYARKGENVEVQPRNIEIYDIKLIEINKKEKTIKFIVKCSKGTYIRTLCENIAEKLGTVGYMKELKRTSVGQFNINNSLKLEELEDIKKIEKNFITIEKFLKANNSIELNEYKLRLFLNGVQLTYNLEENIYRIYDKNNKFIGTGTIKNSLLKRDIII